MTKQIKLLSLCLSMLLLVAAGASSAAERGAATAGGTVEASGAINTGKALFTGEKSFSRGGAPCIACHAFSHKSVASGNLAADITGIYEGMGGDDGVKEVLKSLSFPTMKAIYTGRELTDEEIAALTAFLKDAGEQKSAGARGDIMTVGAALFALLIIALTLYKRRIG